MHTEVFRASAVYSNLYSQQKPKAALSFKHLLRSKTKTSQIHEKPGHIVISQLF
jgi:hypothetical protein